MNFENLYTVSKEAARIEDISRKAGLTFRQYHALVELCNKDTPHHDLQKEIGIENNGQFSSGILSPLREKGYITPRRSGEPLSVTDEGRKVIESIGKRLGY